MFLNPSTDGAISKDSVSAIEKGFCEAMQTGRLADCLVEAVRVVLVDDISPRVL